MDLALGDADRRVVGVKQLSKAILEGAIEKVFIARDAQASVTKGLYELCAEAGVTVHEVEAMQELGAACGIQVGAAAAGIRKALL